MSTQTAAAAPDPELAALMKRHRESLDNAHRRIVKDVATAMMVAELNERGYDVVKRDEKAKLDFEPEPGPPASGYSGEPVVLPTGDFLTPWVPENDRRPPTSPRFGLTRKIDRHLGPARRGECTNCLAKQDRISPAAWRMCNDTGTTVRTLCQDCAEELVERTNSIWESCVELSELTPKRTLLPPAFTTAEEALAWLDEHG